MKKALFFDLDDTIYPTKSVVDDMYKDLFDLLGQHVSAEVCQNIKEDILKTPFHVVAEGYPLDKKVKDEALRLCLDMSYDGPMQTFEDYPLAMDNQAEKFLITGGYTNLQKSKIKQLGIEKDFKEIFIPDPYKSDLSKSDVFKQIMLKYNYLPADVLVIGDNPETELASAKEVGIETYLYDHENLYSPALADYYGNRYDNFKAIVNQHQAI
jgi:putative hydrolase of the HAD superfamily